MTDYKPIALTAAIEFSQLHGAREIREVLETARLFELWLEGGDVRASLDSARLEHQKLFDAKIGHDARNIVADKAMKHFDPVTNAWKYEHGTLG